jgi:hypothetical protein
LLTQDEVESVRDAAKALLVSCNAQRAEVGGQTAPPQALALLRLWDGSPGGMPPALCRQHAAQVGAVPLPGNCMRRGAPAACRIEEPD